MRQLFTLIKHELRLLLISPSTYLVAVLFMGLMGLLYWSILRDLTLLPSQENPMEAFIKTFWIPVFFIVPLLTMRSIAGERSAGTLDTLMTTPIARYSIIFSKFMGAYLLYLSLWLLTWTFPVIFTQLYPSASISINPLDAATFWGSITFIAASGLLFIAIGIFSSSVTKSQLVAAMLTFTSLFLVIAGSQQINNTLANTPLLSWMDQLVAYVQIFQHLDDFSRGIIDSRPLIFYCSFSALLLGLSSLVIEAKS
jgi:ABC-2 type transport system permease protein